ncbi:MAG: ABC transporter permease subunit [Actinobacteria bacterium]|nr:ABC transporter permease subunit [Actinomycetota bacterium]MTB05447.1 ABC transporter permease subunit [Actinomycetota bacterium]
MRASFSPASLFHPTELGLPLMTYLIRGKIALLLKVIVVGLMSAVLLMLAQSAFAQHEYVISGFLALTILALALTYLTKISIPLKFFIPGILLLTAFVIGPILYTVTMSGFNYKTGNIISKEEAIVQIKARGIEADSSGTSFDIKLGTSNGQEAILVSDIANAKYFISTADSRISVASNSVTLNEYGVAISAPDFVLLTDAQLAGADKSYSKIHFAYEGNYFIALEGFDVGIVSRQVLEYVAASDEFKNLVDGSTYRDNGRGNYALADDKAAILEPGWRAPIWFENYSKILTDPRVREPLVRVFIWTVAFALLTVLTTFALGLLLALALNKPIHGRRIYRSILVLPYAMPSVMSILIWGGMFNTEFGAINALLGTNIAWFSDPNFARVAVILVNLWLGFPYFYLISSGSLQAIPSELLEAAAIDGANPRQIFRKITLPLLLQILSPLLIASFAYNFNNFNLIYLLTGGGPRNELDGEIAGATDILISYTYKIAFGTGTQDLGLASAISLIIFVLVASISLYGLRKSKVLETFG